MTALLRGHREAQPGARGGAQLLSAFEPEAQAMITPGLTATEQAGAKPTASI